MGKSVKKLFWRILGGLAGKTGQNTGLPLDLSSIRSILIVRSDRLGDLILSTPVYQSIKQSCPWIKVCVLANRSSSGILQNNPYVDQVITFDKKSPLRVLRDLSKDKFDLAIVLNRMFSSTAASLALLSRAPLRLGYKTREGQSVFNITLEGNKNPQHETQNNLDLLRHLGFTAISESPCIHFTAEENVHIKNIINEHRRHPERPLVLIKPGTRVAAWGWSLQKFQELSERLIESQLVEVFIIQGPGEKNMIDFHFRRANPANLTPVVLPILSAKELACMIKHGQLLLCNHTGIMHMASAVQTPVIAIFKHGDPIRWGPCNTRYQILEERSNDKLSVDDVLENVKNILDKP